MMIIRALRTLKNRSLSSSLCRKVHPPKSSVFCRPTQLFSAARSTSTAAAADKEVFPWRHESILPERVLEHNDFSGAFNPTTRDPPILRKLIAARELNFSAWDVVPIPFYKHAWEAELANNFAVAFEFAMEELLRDTFRVPVKNEDGIVSIDTTTTHDAMDNIIECSMHSADDNEYLKGMMDTKLINRYQINPENLQMKFSLQPIEAQLQHIFAVPVPGLTREIIEDNPYLRGAIYRLHTAYDENGFDEDYFDLLTDFAKHGPDKRTVIAEASIRCMEFFQVKDTSSGNLVQGMEDGSEEEEVVHIVRFEVVTDESQNGEREIGNWKITDIDDLLEGNLFH
ncbi:hypothetical protein ACHAXR_008728 [Thalassiosira sp. AJA248-18]